MPFYAVATRDTHWRESWSFPPRWIFGKIEVREESWQMELTQQPFEVLMMTHPCWWMWTMPSRKQADGWRDESEKPRFNIFFRYFYPVFLKRDYSLKNVIDTHTIAAISLMMVAIFEQGDGEEEGADAAPEGREAAWTLTGFMLVLNG